LSVYLHDVPLPEALNRLDKALAQAGLAGLLGEEEIDLQPGAVGRVLARPVFARLSSPHYASSAMDGFAVRAEDTAGALPSSPVDLRVASETSPDQDFQGLAVYLDTGDPLPAWADAVIPIEQVESLGAAAGTDGEFIPVKDVRHPQVIRLRAAVPPWSHIRPVGEDIVATQLVLPQGQVLRPVDLGALAAGGLSRVPVARRPVVAILPTGSELVPLGQPVKPGDIVEFNSLVLAAQVESWGGLANRLPITPDDFDLICRRVQQAALQADLVLINAGSSAGSEDFSAGVVEKLGKLLVHGVAVRPGHPVILGMLLPEKAGCPRPVPVIGVPGYPVSAALTGEIFIEPLLARWLGRLPAEPVTVTARLTRKVTSPPGDDDYLRVAVGRVGPDLLAAPLARGSGVITSLVRADGIAILPRGSQGLPAGASLSVRLYRHPHDLERTIFAIGSHDIALDLMAMYLARRERRLASANVGSQAGLVALRRGEAHLAGSHLLDPETGQYNLRYIREYLPGVQVKVIQLVGREQGLIVVPGNPKGLRSLDDLLLPGVTFVNRQRGAGTRVLLDYHLSRLRISPDSIRGYTREEYTHLAVAAAVQSGRADCAMGIAAAAQALELEFVPLYQEQYQLVIPAQFYVEPLLAPLLEILQEPAFRQAVADLPGYDTSHMGELVAELE
jgi:putative molybdopterin biosynthesis protein